MGDTEHARILAVCAYLLLAISVAGGELISGRLVPPRRRRTVFGLHRATSIAGLILVAAHGISRLDVASGGQAALGICALVAAGIAAMAWTARRDLASRWRPIHHAAYAAFALATLHVLAFHPPGMRPAEAAMYGSALAAVVGLALWRAWSGRSRPTPSPRGTSPHG